MPVSCVHDQSRTGRFGERLLRRAQELDPQDPQWAIYLRDFAAAQEEMAEPEQQEPVLPDAAPGTLVKRVAPHYPESTQRAGIAGVVQLQGVNGRVIAVQPIAGPFRVAGARNRSGQAAPVQAVSFKWRAETWKKIAVSFP